MRHKRLTRRFVYLKTFSAKRLGYQHIFVLFIMQSLFLLLLRSFRCTRHNCNVNESYFVCRDSAFQFSAVASFRFNSFLLGVTSWRKLTYPIWLLSSIQSALLASFLRNAEYWPGSFCYYKLPLLVLRNFLFALSNSNTIKANYQLSLCGYRVLPELIYCGIFP